MDAHCERGSAAVSQSAVHPFAPPCPHMSNGVLTPTVSNGVLIDGGFLYDDEPFPRRNVTHYVI